MTDREKVIKWLECMSGHAKTCEEGCPNFIQVAPDIGYGAVGYCAKANVAKDALDIVRNAPTVGGWINAQDRLPEEEGSYLCWGADHYDICGRKLPEYITHWVPVLAPPKEIV